MKNYKKDLFTKIKQNYPKLSKGQKLISDYIISHYDKVAFMTASKLGDKVGVSESTVVRFAIALGYGGYPKLQKELQELVRTKLTTVQRIELSDSYNLKEDYVKKVIQSDLDNITKIMEDIDTEVFNKSLNSILNAKRVYILGLRSSKVLAQYLGFYLNFILNNVHEVPSGANDVFDQLINISEEDVIIGISFPRYAKKTLDALKFASSRNATVISITDNKSSPVSSVSKYILTARSNMTSFVDSLVAPMSLINALIIGVSMKDKNETADKFRKLENIWDEYNVYLNK